MSLVGAAALFLMDVFRLWTTVVLRLVGSGRRCRAGVVADLGSGLVHWTADTWGSDQMPVIGRRFLRPFRVHHVDPDDFLRRGFVDCNGDVAMLTLPVLIGAALLADNDDVGQCVGGCACRSGRFGAADQPGPPVGAHAGRTARRTVASARWDLLSAEAHQRHHVSPLRDQLLHRQWLV